MQRVYLYVQAPKARRTYIPDDGVGLVLHRRQDLDMMLDEPMKPDQ